jgi:GTP-binding protein Era
MSVTSRLAPRHLRAISLLSVRSPSVLSVSSAVATAPWVLRQTRGLARSVPQRVRPIVKIEKRLDIAIIGLPNVGKSALLNTLVKEKLAATSRKANTTRREILGVFNHRNTQLVFYDTPGFASPTTADNLSLRSIAEDTSSKADIVCIVVDSTQPFTGSYQDKFAQMVRMAIAKAKIEVVLILNKVDLVKPKSDLLETTRQLVGLINGVKLSPAEAEKAALDTTTFMISALDNDGVIDMKNYFINIAEVKPWLVKQSDSHLTNLTDEERVEQVVLENLLDNVHEEIPYIANIQCKMVKQLNPGRVRIEANIVVDTRGQQKIVVGQQARTLVKIRQGLYS